MSRGSRGSLKGLVLKAMIVPVAFVGGASAASAQELVHGFLNPSFGGNPFYSDHFRALAEIHRPDEPEEPDEPTPTPEELLVSQLQAQLRATLSSNILRAIQTAQVGQSGEFLVGESRINYTRESLGTRVTFTNLSSGEVREIFVPSGSTGVASSSVASAEAALGAPSTSVSLTPGAAQSQAPGLLNLPPL